MLLGKNKGVAKKYRRPKGKRKKFIINRINALKTHLSCELYFIFSEMHNIYVPLISGMRSDIEYTIPVSGLAQMPDI